jgi:hypothetical protein
MSVDEDMLHREGTSLHTDGICAVTSNSSDVFLVCDSKRVTLVTQYYEIEIINGK